MIAILFVLLEFLCGSLMFSYWLGLLAKRNLRVVGDGNPGAINLWRAAGFKYGILGILLDFLKGYFPLIIILKSGYIDNYWIVPVAIAPILGHAFSPFLKLKGGKAIATTFGIWSALTGFEVSLAYAVILALLLALSLLIKKGKFLSAERDGIQVVFGFLLLFIYLYFRRFPIEIFCVWFVNLIVLGYKNIKIKRR